MHRLFRDLWEKDGGSGGWQEYDPPVSWQQKTPHENHEVFKECTYYRNMLAIMNEKPITGIEPVAYALRVRRSTY